MGMGTEVEPHTPHGHGATHCHVNDHIVAGMMALFTVTP